MDIKSLVSPGGGDAPASKTSQSSSPATQRHAPSQSYAPLGGVNGPPPPTFSRHPSQQSTPLYAPPSQDFRSPSGGAIRTGLTPLQTQGPQPGQYPFPHPSQSPVAGPGQQYPQYAGHTATTPLGRPPSHSFQREASSQYMSSGVPQLFQQQHTSSTSPTPPSQHSQTPHSVRQSPHASQHPYPQQLQYQHSQPSTPLGPPSLSYQRTSAHSSHPDTFSPYHQRNLSGASNGVMIGGSPAQHHHSIGHNVDSPGAYTRPSPTLRRTSDYLGQMDRERSLSVSPKTKVPPRVPSQGSRHSSLQESYGGHNSIASSVVLPNSNPSSVAQNMHSVAQNVPSVAQSSFSSSSLAYPHESQHSVAYPGVVGQYGVAQPSLTHPASSVSQHPRPEFVNAPAHHAPHGPQTPLYNKSPPAPQAQPPPHFHQSQNLRMHHLLTPAHEHTPASVSNQKPTYDLTSTNVANHDMARTSTNAFMPAKPKTTTPNPAQESQTDSFEIKPKTAGGAMFPSPHEKSVTPGLSQGDSRKRRAESVVNAPAAKRGKTERKHRLRPIWAQYAPSNPNYDGTNGGAAQAQARHPKQQTPQAHQAPPQQNGRPQANGHVDPATNSLIDRDLERARRLLGPWEPSFKGISPVSDMAGGLSDWLWVKLTEHKDIGLDPKEGAIEIEAKIGTLMPASGSHDRLSLPVDSMCLLRESGNAKYRFESAMEVHEHAMMNALLNRATQEAQRPGRVPIEYRHIYQVDTFDTLSPAGVATLPASVQHIGRDARLRTSTDSKTKKVKDRIIKVKLANIHIYNPRGPYDCRISINFEANVQSRLDSGLHLEDLIQPHAPNKAPPPPRIKDRMSYKHTKFDVDLTKVDVPAAESIYELELEVDSKALREQMRLVQTGPESAYQDIVDGFLNNVTWLMRETPPRG